MTDVLDAAELALRSGDWKTPLLLMLAGLVTSVGPCNASRIAALTAYGARREHRTRTILCFVAGSIAGYLSLAAGWEVVEQIFALGTWVYALAALALIVSGCRQLLGPAHACSTRAEEMSPIAVTALSFSFAWMLSPCCTPLLFGIATLASPAQRTTDLAWFASGHLLPALLAGIGSARFAGGAKTSIVREAAGITAAVVSIAMGLLYVGETAW